jgi:L-iditol 2-dehydrogenase
MELHGARDLRLAERPDPTPGPGEILLRVTAVGVCGSDIHYYTEGNIGEAVVRPGFVMGHEFAGEVVALGEGVSARDFAIGDRVAVDPAVNCGVCEFCETGNPNLCLDLRFAGQPPDIDGSMQQLLPWPAKCCFKLPDSISAAEGAALEPLGVGMYTVQLGEIALGDTVVVLGCGPIGLSAMQFARLAGAARIIALDKLAYRLSVAKETGADDTLLVSGGGHVETVLDWTGGRGADVVIEATGKLDGIADAVEYARRGGRVVWCGIPSEDKVYFHPHSARRKGLTMKVVRRMKHTYPRTIDLVSRGLISASAMITHVFPMEEAARAFDLVADYADGVIKAIVQPNEPA